MMHDDDDDDDDEDWGWPEFMESAGRAPRTPFQTRLERLSPKMILTTRRVNSMPNAIAVDQSFFQFVIDFETDLKIVDPGPDFASVPPWKPPKPPPHPPTPPAPWVVGGGFS